MWFGKRKIIVYFGKMFIFIYIDDILLEGFFMVD
jgi:hypothetical protein